MDNKQLQQLKQINESATPYEFLRNLAELKKAVNDSDLLTPSASSTSFTSSTKDDCGDYHVGTKRRRTQNGSSSSSDHGAGGISLDRLRELAGSANAVSAGGSSTQASPGKSTDEALCVSSRSQTACCCGNDSCRKVQMAGGELECIMENIEFGRQVFVELIDSFTRLHMMKSFTRLHMMKVEAEEETAKTQEQLSEAIQRIRDLEERAEPATTTITELRRPLRSPHTSLLTMTNDTQGPSSGTSGPAGNVGAVSSHVLLGRLLFPLPSRIGRTSSGRTSSDSVSVRAASTSSSSTEIAHAGGSTGTTPVIGSDAAFNSRSSTPGVPNAEQPTVNPAQQLRILQLENILQIRDDSIEDLKARIETQAELRELWDKSLEDMKALQKEKTILQVEIGGLTGEVKMWETRVKKLENRNVLANGQARDLKGLLEKKNEEAANLYQENKALNRDNDRLRRTVFWLQVEEELSNNLKAQLQRKTAELSETKEELRAQRRQNNELWEEVARLNVILQYTKIELAEAQQLYMEGYSSGSLRGSDGWQSYGKSLGSQLDAVAAREREEAETRERAEAEMRERVEAEMRERVEAEMRDRPLRPDAGNVSQDTDRSSDKIITTVVKKRVPGRRNRLPVIGLFDIVREDGDDNDASTDTAMAGPSRTGDRSVVEDDVEEEIEDAPVPPIHAVPTTALEDGEVDVDATPRRAHHHYCLMAGIGALLIGISIGMFVFGDGYGRSRRCGGGFGFPYILYADNTIWPETWPERIWRFIFGSDQFGTQSSYRLQGPSTRCDPLRPLHRPLLPFFPDLQPIEPNRIESNSAPVKTTRQDHGSAAKADALLAALEGRGDRGSNITLFGLPANILLSTSEGLAGVYRNSTATATATDGEGGDGMGKTPTSGTGPCSFM
ncbi:unnamed protein product [Tilletia controversa]|nr:unnamed protein product [Tilletia controversa]